MIPLAERTDAVIQVTDRLVKIQCAMISLTERTDAMNEVAERIAQHPQ